MTFKTISVVKFGSVFMMVWGLASMVLGSICACLFLNDSQGMSCLKRN